MKIVALVPARHGSKRLPGKNTRLLNGKPLISWTLEIATQIQAICDTLVSTDSPEILEISSRAGVLAPWLRPSKLATDTASSVDVALHALDWYESEHGKIDGLLLLQPTSPFRTKETLQKGIDLFKFNGQKAVIGVSPSDNHPMWSMKVENNFLVPFMTGNGLNQRSQDLPMAYSINGSFYLISPKELRAKRTFVGVQAMPLIIETPQESLDIDTAWDWTIAEAVLVSNK